jgi:hypothetical protein
LLPPTQRRERLNACDADTEQEGCEQHGPSRPQAACDQQGTDGVQLGQWLLSGERRCPLLIL